ncbi:hypothetical protein MASR2M15_07880 [Anaerolineales bacterium]
MNRMNLDRNKMIKIAIGLAAIIGVIAIFAFLLQLINLILPLALLILVLAGVYYFGIRKRNSQPELESTRNAVKKEHYEAALEQKTRQKPQTAPQKDQIGVNLEEGIWGTEDPAQAAKDLEARLQKLEEKKLEEAKTATSDIEAQLEARKKRLMNQDQN